MKKLTNLCLILLSLYVNAQGDWELIYGSDSSLNIRNVFMIDTTRIWGVNQGSIFHSRDWGSTWELQHQADDNYLVDIFFTDDLTGWTVGWSEVYHTVDAGVNWNLQTLPNPLGLDVEAVYFINPDTGWIVGSYKTIYVTYDGGDNWISQNDYEFDGHYFLRDVHFYDASHGCAVGGALIGQNPIIMTTEDGGANWMEIYPPTDDVLWKVQFTNEFQVWCCDGDGRIFMSYDRGFTWEVFADLFNVHPDDLYFFDNEHAITGGSSHLYITTDGWNTSEFFELQLANAFNSFSFQDFNKGIAVGNNNILRTSDGGYSWSRMNDRFIRIAYFNPMNGWILPEYLNKNMLHTSDGGSSWSEVTLGQTGKLLEISFPTDETGYVISDEAELLKSTDAGETWEIIDLAFDDVYIRDMQFLDENVGFMCGYPNTLYKTINGGYSWEEIQVDTLSSVVALDFISPLEGWIAYWSGVCGHTTDGGLTWNFVTLEEDRLREINFLDEKNGFITSMFNIFKSEDGGRNWLKLPLFLNQPQNIEFTDSMNGWVTDRVNVYRTYDGGFNWVDSLNLESLNYQDQITDLFLMDSLCAWICTMDGRVFKYADFLNIDEPEEIATCKVYPNPVRDLLIMEFNTSMIEQGMIRLYTPGGKLLTEKQFKNYSGRTIALDLSGFFDGIYILNVKTRNLSETFKIIKVDH